MKLRTAAAALLCAALLAGCGGTGASQSAAAPKDPYESLLLPEGITMRMSAEEFGKAMDIEIDDSMTIEFSDVYIGSKYPSMRGMEEVPLGNYCALNWIKYKFVDPVYEEFEDNRILDRVEFEVRDTVLPEYRTKEKHGDIAAEYETIKAFLIEKLGDPVYEPENPFGLNSTFWDFPDQKMGVILHLWEITKPHGDSLGYLTLEYINTDGYYSDWYQR